MLSDLFQGMWIFFLIGIIQVFVATGSVEYYAAVFSPTEGAIETFLRALRFPFTLFYVHPRYNLLTAQSSKSPVEHLLNASYRRAVANRVVMALASAPCIFILGSLLVESKDIVSKVIYGFWLTLSLVLLALAWRFGHRLKELDSNDGSVNNLTD